MNHSTIYPFTAIVGQDRMKKALVLNAINNRLGGILIRGEKGTAKTTAVRALAKLLPDISVVQGCPYNCDPENEREQCPSCHEKTARGMELQGITKKMHLVELPLGSTEDRVIGTIDIEQAIKRGEKAFQPGILADVNRGILYVDEINLLDDHLVDVLLDAAAMGINYVEREGVSFSHPARFILVGTMNPEEGDLRPQLLDRFGLCVDVAGVHDPRERIEVIERFLEFENNPEAFARSWDPAEKELSALIVRARHLLHRVTHARDIFDMIVTLSLEMGVDGHRADLYMLKTAQTIAAFQGRDRVSEDDVAEAAELVLNHRMRRKPFQQPGLDREKLDEAVNNHKKKSDDMKGGDHRRQQEGTQQRGDGTKPDQGAEELFEPGRAFALALQQRSQEKKHREGQGRRTRVISSDTRGRYCGSALPRGAAKDIALDATIRAAAPRQRERHRNETALTIEKSDLREKVRQRTVGNTIVFVVDSSGSMAAARRMSETKAAVLSLLMEAYRKRDRVALVAFRGDRADVLLRPTSSVELAQKSLEVLPTGGRTPLPQGLARGLEVITRELMKNEKIKPLLVLISDGRTNVAMQEGPLALDQCMELSREVRHRNIQSLVIDTETGLVRLGRLRAMAEAMGARYAALDELQAEGITGLVRQTLSTDG